MSSSRETRAARAARGEWVGGAPPLGYRREGGALVVDADEAAVVRRLFELYVEHRSLGKVARAAKTEKLRSRRGTRFSPATLALVLSRPIYGGAVAHGHELVQGAEPIVAAELVARARALLRANNRHGRPVVEDLGDVSRRGLDATAKLVLALAASGSLKLTTRTLAAPSIERAVDRLRALRTSSSSRRAA